MGSYRIFQLAMELILNELQFNKGSRVQRVAHHCTPFAGVLADLSFSSGDSTADESNDSNLQHYSDWSTSSLSLSSASVSSSSLTYLRSQIPVRTCETVNSLNFATSMYSSTLTSSSSKFMQSTLPNA